MYRFIIIASIPNLFWDIDIEIQTILAATVILSLRTFLSAGVVLYTFLILRVNWRGPSEFCHVWRRGIWNVRPGDI